MSDVLSSLRRQWWLASALGCALLSAGFLGLWAADGFRTAVRWSTLTVPAATAVLMILLRHLPANHPPTSPFVLPQLGLANWVTIARGLLLSVLAGWLLLPRLDGALSWAPGLLYTVAISADFLDGVVARLTGNVTDLGATLDTEFDSLGVLVAVGLAVRYGQLPWPYLLIGLARYLFVTGLWLLKRQGRPVFALTPSVMRRIAAGLQMAFLSVVLWPLFEPPAIWVAGACFGVPFLVGFLRDWLVVSGAVHPTSAGYHRVAGWYIRLKHWLPPILRMGASVLAVVYLVPVMWSATARLPYSAPGVSGNRWAGLVGMLALVAGGLLALGVMNRVAALSLLVAACADLAVRGYQPYHAGLLAASILLLTLGGGAFALWPVDDVLFERRAVTLRRTVADG